MVCKLENNEFKNFVLKIVRVMISMTIKLKDFDIDIA